MAVLLSKATGNWTDATGTWGVVDSTSYLNAETGSEVLTTAYSGTRSSAFTPGAITIDGIAVKLSVRTGTTGTISVNLEKDSDDSQVAGTEITINCSDLPVAATADANGGWIFFKFASPVALAGATAYQVAAKTSSASQVSLFRDGTTDNICRALRTTTEAAPGAGDDVIIAKQWTAPATGTAVTITMNSTAATDYGSASTSQVTPAVAVCQGGTLSFGASGSTNYVLRLSGCAIVYSGGTFNIGSSGSEIPRTSTALLELDCASDGDFGLVARNLSTLNVYGLSRTSGKNVTWCLLASDAAANATSLTVGAGPSNTASAADTGWLDNDVIAIASTKRFAEAGEEAESGTLNGNASAGSLTVDGFGGTGGGLAKSHLGSANTYTAADGQTYDYSMQAEIVLLTRNVKLQSVSASADAYVYAAPTSTVAVQWCEFNHMGGDASTAGKRGFEADTTTGSLSVTYCSFHDSRHNGFRVGSTQSSTWNNVTFQHNVQYNMATQGSASAVTVGLMGSTSNSNWTLDDNVLILSHTSSFSYFIRSLRGTLTNLRASSSGTAAGGVFYLSPNVLAAYTSGTIAGIYVHSSRVAGASIDFAGFMPSGIAISDVVSYRNGGSIYIEAASDITFNNLRIWGDAGFGLGASTSCIVRLNGGFMASDSTYGGNLGLWWDLHPFDVEMSNFDLSPNQGTLRPLNFDFAASGSVGSQGTLARVRLNNCYSGGSTRFSFVVPYQGMYFAFDNLNRVAGSRLVQLYSGKLESDTTATGDGNHTPPAVTVKATPSSTSVKLSTAPFGLLGVQIPAIVGSAPNVGAWVKKSAAYNGNQPRLRVRSNPSIGINSDTTIATGSGGTGSWELLSGTLPTSTGSGLYEVYVDCDGTAGTLNVDFVQNNMAFWDDGLPTGYGHIFYGRLG